MKAHGTFGVALTLNIKDMFYPVTGLEKMTLIKFSGESRWMQIVTKIQKVVDLMSVGS